MDWNRHRADSSLSGDYSIHAIDRARRVLASIPSQGLFSDAEWKIAPEPFPLTPAQAETLQLMGRVLLQFNRAVNLLYRQSISGKQPAWVAHWLDLGKPAELVQLARDAAFKNALPRVIRPDLLLTEEGFAIAELDAVPGGIGLTAWANRTYEDLGCSVVGGRRGMLDGFAGIFGDAARVRIVVSEESAMYRPEMEWLAAESGSDQYSVLSPSKAEVGPGDAVYRFFELFDLPNVAGSAELLDAARQGAIRLTPPPKPIFEEKMLLALLWNRNLREFWRRELGESFLNRMQEWVPYTWLIDPTPLPPHAAIPELGLTDWLQLKTLSQRQRDLILKVSGFSDLAWGARGVHLGSDMSAPDWAAVVEKAINGFEQHPYVLQRYHKPMSVPVRWFDPDTGGGTLPVMQARVRVSPYYFVVGEGDQMRAQLGGVLATSCPADKKIIHGMRDAVIGPAGVLP